MVSVDELNGLYELSERNETLVAAVIAVVVFDVSIIAIFSSYTIQPQMPASQFKIIALRTGKSVRTKIFFMADSFEAVLASHTDAGSSVLSIHHVTWS